MRAIAMAIAVLAACQSDKATSGDQPEPQRSEYDADIGKICDVERLSGADAEETTARSIIAAEWLGRNIKTQQARDFLAKVAPMGAAEKARTLRGEARRAGLADCPTAAAWEKL